MLNLELLLTIITLEKMNTTFSRKNLQLALTAGAVVTATATLSPSAQAASFNLDFNSGADGGQVMTKADGTLVTTQWIDWGLEDISGYNKRTKKAAKLNLYNTDIHGGRDGDLETGSLWGTASQGNALIIQEQDGKSFSNGLYTADDEARGGNIKFGFAKAVALNSFSLLDIDDNGGGIRVVGFDQDENKVLNIDVDSLIAEHKTLNGVGAVAQGKSVTLDGVTLTQMGNRQGDNSFFKFDLADTHLAQVRFDYPGSGAIAGLEWSDGDESTEVPEPSAMAGLLMIGAMGARKLKRQSAS